MNKQTFSPPLAKRKRDSPPPAPQLCCQSWCIGPLFVEDKPMYTNEYKLRSQQDEHVPEFLVENKYILEGYRVYFTFRLCLSSIFRFHNETLNIWTHLLSFWLFVGLTAYSLVQLLVDSPLQDKIFLVLFLCCAKLCFLLSTVYHTFQCHSLTTCLCCAQMDFTGIATLICSCWLCLVNFLFKCHPSLQTTYLSVVGFFAVLMVAFPQLSGGSRSARMCLFGSMAVLGVVPIMHWCVLNGVHSELVFSIAWRFPMCWLIYAVGLAFFALRIPERWSPGTFDVWGHSHQWWHLFVTAGTVWFYYINVVMINSYKQHPCVTIQTEPMFSTPQ